MFPLHSQPTHRYNICLLMIFVLVATSSCQKKQPGSVQSHPPAPSLLDHAICILPRYPGDVEFHQRVHRWISDHVFVYCRELNDQEIAHRPKDAENIRDFVRYDVSPRRMRSLQGYNGDGCGRAFDSKFDGVLSPDGRFMIWSGNLQISGYLAFITSSDPTIASVFLPQNIGSYPCWSADSRHVYLWDEVDVLWEFDVKRPQAKRRLRFAPADWHNLKPSKLMQNMAGISLQRLIADDSPDDWFTSADQQPTKMKVVVMHPGPEIALIEQHLILLPVDKKVIWRTYSPQGDRIAWCFQSRLVPTRMEYWTSKIDGTAWRHLGDLEANAANCYSNVWRMLRWLPDGKRLGFIFNGAMYIVFAG